MNILILCTGNSCRSQMGEGLMRSFNKELNVYSAGTNPAKSVNPNSIVVMNEIGIDISSYVPNNVSDYIEMDFDYVITVCDHANETCPVLSGNVKKRLHIGFEDPYHAKGTQEEVLNVYRKVRDQIKSAFYNLYLSEIREQV